MVSRPTEAECSGSLHPLHPRTDGMGWGPSRAYMNILLQTCTDLMATITLGVRDVRLQERFRN